MNEDNTSCQYNGMLELKEHWCIIASCVPIPPVPLLSWDKSPVHPRTQFPICTESSQAPHTVRGQNPTTDIRNLRDHTWHEKKLFH